MRTVLWLFCTCVIGTCYGVIDMPQPEPNTNTYKLRMPGVTPLNDDDYLCTAFKLGPEEKFVTEFRVEGTAERAHHMLLVGCSSIPGLAQTQDSWNCGSHGTCAGSSRILYAWAKNAAGTRMPPSVGFRIGGSKGRHQVKYLVVQVHYSHKLQPHERDFTGLDMEITSQPQKYVAGIMLLMASPEIPPNNPLVNADSCCPFSQPSPVRVFAARVHAHELGVVISSYKYNPKTEAVEKIVKGNPQWPQAFFPTSHEINLEHGDEILSRCTYNSIGRTTTTYSGMTGKDEMCNIYLMYYTDAQNGTEYETCGYVCNPKQNLAFPADSVEPLPRNLLLEEYAIHRRKHVQTDTSDSTVHPDIITHDEHDKVASVEESKTGSQQQQDPAAVSSDPMILNRVHYKDILSDGQHKHELDHQTDEVKPLKSTEAAEQVETVHKTPLATENGQQTNRERENKFWSILFFYRRFLS